MFKVSEIQLTYRSKIKVSMLPKILCSSDSHRIFSKHWDQDRIEMAEDFKVMLLNRANRCNGIVDISAGGTSGTVADIKFIFASAILSNSSSIIIAHNHPSGNLKPSRNDRLLTDKVFKSGKLLEIPLTDHLIITSEGYYSFADQGLI